VGDALGTSEKLTKGILTAASGKVLVIDEAYGLYGGGSQASTSDPYKTAVIDTIVAEVQSVPGDDRCVLLLGYHEQMEQMFQNVNPGLSRRFPLASAFVFNDFSNAELSHVLDLKLKTMGFKATDQAKKVAMEMLDRARNRPNFGNAGEIDILLDAAKARHQSRISSSKAKYTSIFEALDFDANFDRADRSETNIKKLFEETVGSEDVVKLLEGYQDTVRASRSLDLDPKENIPFNFLFRGPPGTGKTTTARKMGKVFYDMGFLATASVEDCSASDLVGQYVGQTGPKVRQLLDKALGKVLFIDEAYRLAGGHFAQEALDELTDSITKPQYAKKLVIILAGYEKDINRLMSMNPGLTSRFPEVVDFRQLTALECVDLLQQKLRSRKALLQRKNANASFDISSLDDPSEDFRHSMEQCFHTLSTQRNWASARDVGTLAINVFNRALRSQDKSIRQLVVLETDVRAELDTMVAERRSRDNFGDESLTSDNFLASVAPPVTTKPDQRQLRTTTNIAIQETEPGPDEQPLSHRCKEREQIRDFRDAPRDAGVSDEVWEQLQKDKQAERDREEEFQRLKKAKDTASGAARDKILKQLLEEEDRRKREEEMQKKLEVMGVCPMGYQWIKQADGYRCAGGSHFLDNNHLASH
jgi:SpoVK/Ycf46/Vps4 family AAA+-type ATPase